MKLKLISAVIAASFLAGCSSSGSDDNNNPPQGQDGVANVQAYQGDELAAAVIRGDHGDYNAMVVVDSEGNGVIRLNGTMYEVTNGDVTTPDGTAVGSIQAQDGGYIFRGENGAEVKLTNVDGRLIVSDYTPPRPDNKPPIDGVGGVQVFEGNELAAALILGDEGNYQVGVIVDQEGSGYIRVNDTTYYVENGDVTNKDGQAIGSVQSQDGSYIFRAESGAEVTLTNVDGRLIVSNYIPPTPDNTPPAHPDQKGWTIVAGEHGKLFEIQHNGVPVGTATVNGAIVSNGEQIGSWENLGETNIYTINIDEHTGQEGSSHVVRVVDGTVQVITANESRIPGVFELRVDENVVATIDTHTNELVTAGGTTVSYLRTINNNWIFAKVDGNLVMVNKHTRDIKTIADFDYGKLPAIPTPMKAELKSKLQSLSQEQRQQIKQAIKDRAVRS